MGEGEATPSATSPRSIGRACAERDAGVSSCCRAPGGGARGPRWGRGSHCPITHGKAPGGVGPGRSGASGGGAEPGTGAPPVPAPRPSREGPPGVTPGPPQARARAARTGAPQPSPFPIVRGPPSRPRSGARPSGPPSSRGPERVAAGRRPRRRPADRRGSRRARGLLRRAGGRTPPPSLDGPVGGRRAGPRPSHRSLARGPVARRRTAPYRVPGFTNVTRTLVSTSAGDPPADSSDVVAAGHRRHRRFPVHRSVYRSKPARESAPRRQFAPSARSAPRAVVGRPRGVARVRVGVR